MPLNERKCTHCNDLGDEFHYLFKCDLFSEERREYIKPYYYKHPNILKYNEIMNTSEITTLKKTQHFYYQNYEISKIITCYLNLKYTIMFVLNWRLYVQYIDVPYTRS